MLITSIYQAPVVATKNYAAQFSSSAYLSANASNLAVADSVSWEIELDLLASSLANQTVVSESSAQTSAWHLYVYSTTKIRLALFDGGGSNKLNIYTDDVLTTNNWCHIRAGRAYSASDNVYSTGFLEVNGTRYEGTANFSVASAPRNFNIGRSLRGSYTSCTSAIDNVKFTNNNIVVARYDFQNANNLGLDSAGANNLTNVGGVTQIEVTN